MSTETPQQQYEDYLKERQQLNTYEQQAYDNYAKTILTLSSSFLIFSVSFLAILERGATGRAVPPQLQSTPLLVWSWISFASSVMAMLLCFGINAKALRAAVADIEPLAEGKEQTAQAKKWNSLCYAL
jgi:hypothetical protein